VERHDPIRLADETDGRDYLADVLSNADIAGQGGEGNEQHGAQDRDKDGEFDAAQVFYDISPHVEATDEDRCEGEAVV
jgi:hypothetical protein